MTTDHAYLSVIRWPEGMEREDIVRALHRATGVDAFHARQRLAVGTPTVVQRIDASIARDAVSSLQAAGVPAIAPTLSQLRAVAEPIPVKRISPALGAPEPMFMCEPWREEPLGFTAREIAIIVRARVTRSASRTRTERTTILVDPIYGVPVSFQSADRESRSSLHDLMDVYLRGRRCLRCAGDKFSFDALGDNRGYSDNENMDKLAVLLAEAAPNALVDVGFADFSCPPAILRSFTTTSGVTHRDEHPAFDFYSPWIVLVHVALAKGEKSHG